MDWLPMVLISKLISCKPNDCKKVKVKPQIATAVMDKFDTYRTTDQKLKFQQKIAKSYKDLLSALKEK